MTFVLPGVHIQTELSGDRFKARADVACATDAVSAWSSAATFDYDAVADTYSVSGLSAGSGQVVDTITPVVDDRVLIKDLPSAGSANSSTHFGIFRVMSNNATSMSLVRAPDMLVGDSPAGVIVSVRAGANRGADTPKSFQTQWQFVASGLVGSTAMSVTQIDAANVLQTERGGTGLSTFAANQLMFSSAADTLAMLPTGANMMLTTDASGVPSLSATLPSGMAASDLSALALQDAAGAQLLTLINANGSAASQLSLNAAGSRSLALASDLTVNTGDVVLSGAAGGSTLTLPASGTLATEAYVDGVVQGLDIKDSVRLTTAPGGVTSLSYAAPVLTLTSETAGTTRGLIDSVEPAVGDRVLVKDSLAGDAKYFGIWTVSATTGSNNEVFMVRATDSDTSAKVTSGMFAFVEEGSVGADNGYTLVTNDPLTLNTTDLTFAQFSGAGQVIAGQGLSKSGNQLDVDLLANGGLLLNGGQIGLDMSGAAITGTLAVAQGGTGAASHTVGRLLEGNGSSAVNASVVAADVVTATAAASAGNLIPRYVGASKVIEGSVVTVDNYGNLSGVDDVLMSGVLRDADASKLINLNTVGASAANELSVSNALTGAAPSLSVSGDDSNVDLMLAAKGTGAVVLKGTAASAAQLRLQDASGAAAVELKAPASTAGYSLTLPETQASLAGQYLRNDGAGALSWVSHPHYFTITTGQLSADSAAAVNIAHFPWNSAHLGNSSTLVLSFYAENLSARGVTVTVLNNSVSIGSVTAAAGSASGLFKGSIAVSISVDTVLRFSVSKSAVGGANPQVYGITMSLA